MLKSLRTFIQTYKRVRQHATIFSLIVVILLFGLFLEAYMHDFNLVYITLFFLFSLAFSAGPIGVMNLGRLQTHLESSTRFFANKEGELRLKISNPSTQNSWAITLHDNTQKYTVNIPLIKAHSSLVVSLPFRPASRGTFTYEGCFLESRYPLSTARLTLPVTFNYQALAYPEPKGKSLAAFLHHEESHYGDEKEFHGLQAYDGTQRLSHIDWASVAKGEVSVKSFIKERETPHLVFDFHQAGTDKEERLSQLCLWVLECERQKLSFKLNLPHRSLDSTKDPVDEILTALALF